MLTLLSNLRGAPVSLLVTSRPEFSKNAAESFVISVPVAAAPPLVRDLRLAFAAGEPHEIPTGCIGLASRFDGLPYAVLVSVGVRRVGLTRLGLVTGRCIDRQMWCQDGDETDQNGLDAPGFAGREKQKIRVLTRVSGSGATGRMCGAG